MLRSQRKGRKAGTRSFESRGNYATPEYRKEGVVVLLYHCATLVFTRFGVG